MHRLFYPLFIPLLLLLASCRDESSPLGQSLVESSFYNIYIDTCTVDISTILMDSLKTRGDSICQLGQHYTPMWGDIRAAYYAEYNTHSFTPDDNNSYELDSLVLHLVHSGQYLGDTLTRQHISVHRIKYPIDLTDGEDLYSHTVLPIEETPLCSFSFIPRPGQKKELDVRLPDEWGRQLLDDLVRQADYFSTQDKFKTEFPGLAFVSDDGGSCITGFQVNDSSMTLNLHYQEISSQRVEQTHSFEVNSDHAYTRISHDRSGTPLSVITPGIENYVHSYQTNHQAYLQGLTGLYNQLEFPYLNILQDCGDIVSVEEATLYLYPLAGSYNTVSQLPSEIRLYITNENNVLEDYVYGSDGVTLQTGNLTVDEMFGRETYYSFDVTDFMRNNLGAWGFLRQKLLLNLTDNDMQSTFNQVIFTNNPDKERQCRLTMRLKIYNEQ